MTLGIDADRQNAAAWLESDNSHFIKEMTVEAFTKLLDANPEVAKKVAACQNYNEVAEIAKANGINISGAELTKYAAEQTAQLSDEQLEAVAGGSWQDQAPGITPPTIDHSSTVRNRNPVYPMPISTLVK